MKDKRLDNCAFDEKCLLEYVRKLFCAEPTLKSIFGFEPQEVKTNGELLAAVLAGLIPETSARVAVRNLACDIFETDKATCDIALEDLNATAQRDIDTGGLANVLFFAHGYQGLLSYRLSRALLNSNRETAANMIKALYARILNLDIAPQAVIGRRVWLDHGLGVVIGRTAIIEDDVSLWHGVTLGSNLVDTGARRHPKIGRGVVLGAHSTILGGIDVGAGAIVASGAIVTRSIDENVTVYGSKAIVRKRRRDSFSGFDVNDKF